MSDGNQDPGKGMWIAPLGVLVRVVVLFTDVLTLMLRLLVNTLLYDTPHGKGDLGIGARIDDSRRA